MALAVNLTDFDLPILKHLNANEKLATLPRRPFMTFCVHRTSCLAYRARQWI